MHNFIAKPAKMLIISVGRRRGEALVCAAKSAGARGGTLALGKSLHDSKILRALSLGDVQQDIVFVIMGEEKEHVVTAVKAAAASDPGEFGGIAVVLDVPQMFIRSNTSPDGQADPGETRSEAMESGYKLISVIVNAGYGDDVMAAARKAGASGGSILTARGTGTEEDVKFFGITLVPEKEMLMIVAEEGKVKSIVEQIATVPSLGEPGGGIVFNMNVEEFIVLGK